MPNVLIYLIHTAQRAISYHETFEHKCKTNVAWLKCNHIENYKHELDKLISCTDFNHDPVSCVY